MLERKPVHFIVSSIVTHLISSLLSLEELELVHSFSFYRGDSQNPMAKTADEVSV